MLTRDQVLASLKSKPEMIEVDVPEWGGTVNVRLLSESEVETMTANKSRGRSRFASVACCDDDGARLFTDADVEILANALGGFAALDRIWTKGAKFNNLLAENEGSEKN